MSGFPKPSIVDRLRGGQQAGSAVDGLRSQWSSYPESWRNDERVNQGVETLGDEWGGPGFAELIVDRLLAAYLTPERDVIELGCGGGRFSQRIAPRANSLRCCDISPQMLELTRQELAKRGAGGNVDFTLLNGSDFDGVPDDSADLIFSYDVQLHLQPQNVFSYMIDARRVLRPGGVFMLHQIALDSPGGRNHFLEQFSMGTWNQPLDGPKRLGHIYFMSEDQMRALADLASMDVLSIVDDFPGEDSEYYDITRGRDLIGFFRPRPGRLTGGRIVRAEGEDTVYAVLADGTRGAIHSPEQFERAGLDWDALETIRPDELAAIPPAEPPIQDWE